MRYVLGIDISTTATKAVLVDETGTVVGVGTSEYSYDSPQPGWTEQDPARWWKATVAAIRDVLAATGVRGDAIEAVGLTGQMHGLVILDDSRRVLRPAILWNDQRTEAECDQIRQRVGRDRLLEVAGNDALTGFTAPKMLWVRNHEPDVFRRVAHALLPKDYVRLRLTDELATDKAGAAGTLLFDVAARDWSGEVLDALDIPAGWLPPTHEGPDVTGYVTNGAAEASGLAAGTPVVAGGGDQAANAVGVGAVMPGVVALSLGTSGVVFGSTSAPTVAVDGWLHAFCHAVPGMWHLMGVMLSAAGSLRWYRDTLAPGISFSDLDLEASAAAPGADGVIFLPYLTGERTPHADPQATGAFVGMTVRHDRAHLTRAVLEGVAFGLRDNLDAMKAAGFDDVRQIRASGGGTASLVWRQILADVLGAEIVATSTTEGAAYGAAMLAAVGTGWFGDVPDACDRWITVGSVTAPGPDSAAYDGPYDRYRRLYPALRDWFRS